MSYGYNFYFSGGSSGLLTFPITPGELTLKVGSNNKVVNLISEGDINILKSPALTEIEFEARFPMRNYPYSRDVSSFQNYYDKFKALKENKESFRFIVTRTTPKGKRTWDTNILVSLEEFEINENADEGDDVIVTFTLKQYKEYGLQYLKTSSSSSKTTSTSKKARATTKGSKSDAYTVKTGDCLWNIAKKYYGDGSQWTKIYEANKSTIESTATSRGMGSSSNGHWIFEGTKLNIPAK